MRTPPRPMRPRRPDTVQLFTAGPPRWRYIEVGIIESEEVTRTAEGEYVLDDIRSEAAERGCDGLLLNVRDRQENSFSGGDYGAFGGSRIWRGCRAVCIVSDGP